MKSPRIAKKIIEDYHALATPNVADALDRHGIKGMPRGLMPLYPTCGKLVGPAATMKLLPLGSATSAKTTSPVLGTLEAIVAGHPGDVLVIDFGGNTEVNSMGGVAGATAKHHGLVGCVSDGVARDIEEYRDLDFPMYGKGYITTSIRSRCVFGGHSIDVSLSGVIVRPGDLIMADWSGAVVVPHDRVEEILKLATELKGIEDSVIAAVRGGEDPVEAHEKVRYDAMTSQKA